MKNKLFTFILTLYLICSCLFIFIACEPSGSEIDATLYRLTLSSNIVLDGEQKEQLKATYGYGEPSATVKKGDRDQDEIEQLKKAGATDDEINKVGVRQSNGSYFFFDQDPIYLEAPIIKGYKLMGFYNKANNQLVLNPILQNIDGGMYLPRYNMDSKNVEIEARYQKWTYTISFDTMEEGDVNPNNISSYCYIDEPTLTLKPATTENTHKTFIGWVYQDFHSNTGSQADWIALEKSGNDFKLPSDYYEEYMRIGAVWDVDKLTIRFAFERYIDPETSEPLTFADACEKISVQGNIATVNGEPVKSDSPDDRTPIFENSELKIEYGSWLAIFPTATTQYNIWYCEVNGEIKNLCLDYFSFSEREISQDVTIKFILTDKPA